MKRALPAVVLACACAHTSASTPRDVAQKAGPPPRLLELPAGLLLEEARGLMARSRWDDARERLEAFLLKEPRSGAGLFAAGFVAEQRGQAAEAQDFYRRALESDPGEAGAAVNLARLLEGEPVQAEQVLRRSLAAREGDPRLLNALAAVLVAQGKLGDAESAVRQALSRHPRDAGAYRNLAAVESAREHGRMAESLLQTARKLDDKDPSIPHALGLLAMKRDDLAAARAFFEQAAGLDPAFAPAWSNLGALALRYRDYGAAERAYAKALQLDGERWESRLAHAWALEGLKKPKEARAEFEKVLVSRPGQEEALYGRALALKAEGDLPAALQAFRAYAANPNAARLKEAQGQIAAIDLRLKNPVRKAAPKPAAALDLNGLPQGSDSEPSGEKLPVEEEPPASQPGPEKAAPREPGKDGGVAAAR